MAKRNNNTFKKAVEATPDIENCYQPGLKSLGVHSSKITLDNTSLSEGSVDIDTCVTSKYPNDSRWDYCLSYKGKTYFVEVHTANTREVGAVLKKLQWLKDWLISNAPELIKLKAKQPFYWIQSGNYSILPNSKQERRMAQVGLKPIPKLHLK